jgi:hypothetical protein
MGDNSCTKGMTIAEVQRPVLAALFVLGLYFNMEHWYGILAIKAS